MSGDCEFELCPFWSGTGGCDCAVFDISSEERARQKRRLGIATTEEQEMADG